MNQPLVTVIIPVYKCNAYIRPAIASVLDQSYRNFEVIVVDGGPGEDTRLALAPYGNEIRYLYQEPRGVSAARNFGIQHARGELIAFQDADDIWHPEKLKLQMQALESHRDAVLVFTDAQTFDHTGILQESVRSDMLSDWCAGHGCLSPDVAYGSIYELLLAGNCVNTCSAIVKREALDDVGAFDEAFATCEDYDLWLRIAPKYPVVFINRVLCQYRIHADGLSGDAEQRYIRWKHDGIRVREKHRKGGLVPPEHRIYASEMLSQRCWELGLWLGLVQWYSVPWVDRMLQGCRYQPQGSLRPSESSGLTFHQDALRIINKHLRNKRIPRTLEDRVTKELSQHCWNLGSNLFGQNRFPEARSRFVRGMLYYPFHWQHWLYWVATWLPLSIIEAVRKVLRWWRSLRLHAEPAARNFAITPSDPEGPRRTI